MESYSTNIKYLHLCPLHWVRLLYFLLLFVLPYLFTCASAWSCLKAPWPMKEPWSLKGLWFCWSEWTSDWCWGGLIGLFLFWQWPGGERKKKEREKWGKRQRKSDEATERHAHSSSPAADGQISVAPSPNSDLHWDNHQLSLGFHPSRVSLWIGSSI